MSDYPMPRIERTRTIKKCRIVKIDNGAITLCAYTMVLPIRGSTNKTITTVSIPLAPTTDKMNQRMLQLMNTG